MSDSGSLDIEVSPISGRFARSGIAVNVRIYRHKNSNSTEFWNLEVTGEEGSSSFSEYGFTTDQDAFKAFYHMIEENGIAAILDWKTPVGKSRAGSS
ncbi:hypothetical protein [Phyllobacterium sp. SB3]|uniref:hypothetical protein n=1 Tax=Phyllobacterium sp. SB3 TaxID=3156073 RepID=UPI0032AF5733